jgi:hypothetical protein
LNVKNPQTTVYQPIAKSEPNYGPIVPPILENAKHSRDHREAGKRQQQQNSTTLNSTMNRIAPIAKKDPPPGHGARLR